MRRLLPWLLGALVLTWILAGLPPPRRGGFELGGFGALPVLKGGRLQPFETVAGDALLQIHSRRSLRLAEGRSLGPADWLLDLLFRPEEADREALFRVDNPEVLSFLGLPEGGSYLSFAQLEPHLDLVAAEGARIANLEAPRRSAYERELLRLSRSLELYRGLEGSFFRRGVEPLAELSAYEALVGPGVEAAKAKAAGKPHEEAALAALLPYFSAYRELAGGALLLPIPPAEGGTGGRGWESLGDSLLNLLRGTALPPATGFYAALGSAYRGGDAGAFNRALGDYRRALVAAGLGPELARAGREAFFDRFEPFSKATLLYVLALLLGLLSWFSLSGLLRRPALTALGLAWLLHSFGLGFRMYLEGRPPVTNLYSSAVFVGWAAVLLGLLLERLHRDGIGLVAASLVGFVTQLIAHNLSLGGDTMEPLRAVLDTNVWLATHVVFVSLGYAASFVAGLLGLIFILRGSFSAGLTREVAVRLGKMVYGTVAFATLFSFVGTVLGGIWADQSWGRFWGWDPKENGALLIVLWNAVILHAVWEGMVKERGLMVLAVFGNAVTAFSWFGVNLLGIGLHSYGFSEAGAFWLYGVFIPSQLLLVLLGLRPLERWKSRFVPPGRPRSP